MLFSLLHLIYSVTLGQLNLVLPRQSGMMKQQKVVAFCYNCDMGQDMDFNILFQQTWIYLYTYTSVLQGSTSPSVMRMGITNRVSAMEAWGSAGVSTDTAMRYQDPERTAQQNVVS